MHYWTHFDNIGHIVHVQWIFIFRISITALRQLFWCIIHGVYLVWELIYCCISQKMWIIVHIVHIGHVHRIFSFTLLITALRQSFLYIIHRVYLVWELIYSCISLKMCNIGHILSNIGHIWLLHWIFFFQIINQCIETVILMYNTWGLSSGDQNRENLLGT